MIAKGRFEVSLEPKVEDTAPAGRMVINKTYHGDLQVTGIGQMISKRVNNGASVYSAIEEVSAVLEGKQGSFTLYHTGFMNADSSSLSVVIVEGSGSQGLAGISGELKITLQGDKHLYELIYQLD